MKKILYLGSDPLSLQHRGEIIHLPLIELVPRPYENFRWIVEDWEEYTHLLFTSKHAVCFFSELLKHYGRSPMHRAIAVGKATAKEVVRQGWKDPLIAERECQEGIIALLRKITWSDETYVLMPRSSRARGSLEQFFLERGIRHQVCDLYDTKEKKAPLPDLEQFDEIFFSSPSTVSAFFSLLTTLPKRPELKAIGTVTWQNLLHAINIHRSKMR